jgi:hypothetical protein
MLFLAMEALTACKTDNKIEVLASKDDFIQNTANYFEQKPPSKTPEIFAPGLISKANEYEFGSILNNDMTEFFYGVYINGKTEIRYSKVLAGKWTKPKVILNDSIYGFNDPFLSPDENRLYFISQWPKNQSQPTNDYDIWYVNRTKNGWSKPVNAGSNINSSHNEYYISFTKTGTLFFSSNKKSDNYDIYSSELIDGEYQSAEKLSDSINTNIMKQRRL